MSEEILLMIIACVVLCTGESGVGKSTIVNSLFLTDLYAERRIPNATGLVQR